MQFDQFRRRDFITLLGGAGTWSLAAHAQSAAKSYRVGYLSFAGGEDATWVRPLLERLHELGYDEDRNMIFDYRSAEAHLDRLESLAVELVQRHPDVLVAGNGTLTAQALKAASTTLPVVFIGVGDPLAVGLVASLNRPGGNITGLTGQPSDVVGKRLQLLLQLVPRKQIIAVLMNPDTPYTSLALKQVRAAVEGTDIRLEVLETRSASQLAGNISAAVKVGADALLILEDPLLFALRREIADLAAQAQLPSCHGYREFVEAGGLMSYGTDRRQMVRRAAEFVDKILKGTKPADIPVERPTKFELLINLKAAKALGIAIPPTLLALADEVIE
jgi:putative ABC transport system substrate-binding protein